MSEPDSMKRANASAVTAQTVSPLIARASCTRPRSRVKIVPDMPYFTEFAIAIASSYPCASITASTGPNTSSCASVDRGSTSAKTVGAT